MRPSTTYVALVGAVVARLRRQANLQQAELGQRMGVNQSSWSKIERGETAMSVEYLALLKPVLHIEPHEVLAAADRVVAYAEGQGVQVFVQRTELSAEAMQGQLSGRALVALVEAGLAEQAGLKDGR